MERSEPSLVPEWLKGASGGSQASPHLASFQEDGSSTRSRTTQQASGSHLEYDSPRGAVSSDRSLFLLGQRGHGSNSSNALERTSMDRENQTQGRLHPSLSHSGSSRRSYVPPDREKEWDGHRADLTRERDWLQGSERSTWAGLAREFENFSVTASDERKSEKDSSENGKLWLSSPGTPGSYDAEAKLWRSQSMGLSPRMPDINTRKMNECVTTSSPMPSASGGLATSMQKAVFERNFPSLGLDDKLGGLVVNSGSSPIASPRPLWQSPSRSDLCRASSPGLPGGIGGPPVPLLSINSAHGGGSLWNSVLAEVPISNDNLQNISLGNALPGATALNMAEALSQAPQRVRTPPQSAAECQRLEEFALKQSRQLIPMTPTFPKTMTLNDKAKSKALRSVDGTGSSGKLNQLSGALQSNSFNRSSTTPRPDTAKHAQGKLLVLKASKDGGILSTTGLRSEGSNPTPISTHASIGGTATTSSATGLSISGNTGVIGQSKRPLDHRVSLQPGTGGFDASAGARTKDLMEDKRTSSQAQNRSDFFNTLRKKAAGNGNTSSILKSDSLEVESVVLASSEGAIPEKADIHGHNPESEVHVFSPAATCVSQMDKTGKNGAVDYPQREVPFLWENVCTENNTSAMKCAEERLSVGSEEEEAAFMRSLGWEENAEGSELTEEEINSFYQMRERKTSSNSQVHPVVRVEPCLHPSEIPLSGMSSSESDSDG